MQYHIKENCLTIFLPAEVDHHNAEEIKREADRLLGTRNIRSIIFDFEKTSFMDSSGIALLIRARQRMQELGGTADVCGAAAQARRVLDAAGLQRYLTIR